MCFFNVQLIRLILVFIFYGDVIWIDLINQLLNCQMISCCCSVNNPAWYFHRPNYWLFASSCVPGSSNILDLNVHPNVSACVLEYAGIQMFLLGWEFRLRTTCQMGLCSANKTMLREENQPSPVDCSYLCIQVKEPVRTSQFQIRCNSYLGHPGTPKLMMFTGESGDVRVPSTQVVDGFER